ncbi:pyruvate dehydrogenase complex dihydrolipoamide acetyltransferase [Croceicoccus marinus]|jgi:pyruvate dehydrogenase E2 component (dihydrolipoamide acetyltransferase)|uniref:Acetyltransferase component of pyruvate dehydrogenase complex n=1 Tax=Croceicoccus marinus TaxID=450378 RepID=A0A7G6VQH1_9SPHN|nr:pyruvate dehydrogenase complex dihydrolipoamide acetyltransferase [Croceicoccus marinus]QNE03986.1 pyruvate dehydrogenase complex dihydrolipoamide acetyltransferase [Croceicoccus marinus]
MPISLKMPALSPTMEEGTLAKWLVKTGDKIGPGDIIAEIETDKATMEFEAIDEGTIAAISVDEGTENVKVGTVIAVLAEEGEDVEEAAKSGGAAAPVPSPAPAKSDSPAPSPASAPAPAAAPAPSASPAPASSGERVFASPLARRMAADKNIDLSQVSGSGPRGRIVKADIEGAKAGSAKAAPAPAASAPSAAPASTVEMSDETRAILDARIPHQVSKLSGMRKTIARRLTESKQQVPHIYLTVDVRLDKLLALRGEINKALESQGVKISVNDLLVKALGKALIAVPECNVAFSGSELIQYERADISVAVSIPAGLITPIISDADGRSVSSIATAMKDLAGRAREGKLQPEEYQGGTASLSNMGMMGIKQFEAVINPPQGMILAIGAGEKRAIVDDNGEIVPATMMSATGSFDHRAIDGADGARLMAAFRELVENPLGMLA